MPGIDGIETLKRIKEINPAVGVVMVTAVNEEDLARRAMKIGAYDYITKPIDLDYLRTSVVIKIIDTFGSEKAEWEP